MDCASLRVVLLYGLSSLWTVLPYGLCSPIGCAPLQTVFYYGLCSCMGCAPLWAVLPYGLCSPKGCAPLYSESHVAILQSSVHG